jgi:hypothetical protein
VRRHAIAVVYCTSWSKKGPYSSAQLKQFAKLGQLQPTDQLWKGGMQQWVYWSLGLANAWSYQTFFNDLYSGWYQHQKMQMLEYPPGSNGHEVAKGQLEGYRAVMGKHVALP